MSCFCQVQSSSPFLYMAKVHLHNDKIVINWYHFIRQVYHTLENVRNRVQKNNNLNINFFNI
ncbi:transposase [Lachnoanaerobaculum gingivalis]|uniref:transposase n=1 Tax=Lachnoanaerobaculum gingivalis TaxID=2490855 RepID=UPI003A7F2B4D